MLPMLFADAIFALAGHAAQVRVEEVMYFRILCLATPAMLVSSAFSCFYSGQGKTWVVMLVDMGSVLLNIVLDYAWIFGHAGFPAAGIAGGAWATFVAIAAKVVVYLVLLALPGESPHVRFAGLGVRLAAAAAGCSSSAGRPACRCCWRWPGSRCLCSWWEAWGSRNWRPRISRSTSVRWRSCRCSDCPRPCRFWWASSWGATTRIWPRGHLDQPVAGDRATWRVSRPCTSWCPTCSCSGSSRASPPRAARKSAAIAVVLLRYVAAYNLFDALNMVFVNAIKGAGDTRFVFVTSLLMAVVLAVGTWVAMEYFGAGLHGCWGLVTAWIWVLGVVYLPAVLCRVRGVRCG